MKKSTLTNEQIINLIHAYFPEHNGFTRHAYDDMCKARNELNGGINCLPALSTLRRRGIVEVVNVEYFDFITEDGNTEIHKRFTYIINTDLVTL